MAGEIQATSTTPTSTDSQASQPTPQAVSSAPSTPEPVSQPSPQSQPASQPSQSLDDSLLLKTLSERTGLEIPESITSVDSFADLIDSMAQRASLLPENATQEQIKSWQQAAAFQQQVAPQWDEFQRWYTNQQQAQQVQSQPNIQQQAQPAQPVVEQPAAEEWKPRWQFPEISESDLRFVEQDQNGQYRPVDAVKDSFKARQIAELANQHASVAQDFIGNLTRRPYETAKELFRPAMSELESRWEKEKLEPLKQQLSQLQEMLNPVVEMTQQQQLAAFEEPYADYLYTDATKSQYTPAGKMYATLASRDIPLDQALAMVLEAIPPQQAQTNIVQEQPAATQQPAEQVVQQVAPAPQQPKPQPFIRKRQTGRMADQRTGQPIEQTAVISQDIPDSMLMSNDQLFSEAFARAQQKVTRAI